VAAERIEAGAELRDAGEEAGERLPESGEKVPVSWAVRGLLSGDGREGEEGEEEEEDDGGARPHPARLGISGHEDLQGRSGSANMAGVAGLQEVVCRVVRGKAGVEGARWGTEMRVGCPPLPGKELR
jgi:hypothetical protein